LGDTFYGGPSCEANAYIRQALAMQNNVYVIFPNAVVILFFQHMKVITRIYMIFTAAQRQ